MLEIISSKKVISSKNDFIKNKHFLAEHKIKKTLSNYFSNVRMEIISMNTKNSKTNEPHKLPNEQAALQNFYMYYIWKNMRQYYENNKVDYSVSAIQDYIEYIMKNYDTLTTNPPIHISSTELIIDYCSKRR